MDKVKEAGAFRRNGKIGAVKKEALGSKVKRAKSSNVLSVLGKYLTR